MTYLVMGIFSRSKEIIFDSDDVYRLRCGTIFVLNHKNPLDPWIFFHSLPFKVFLKVLPIRIYAGTKFGRNPLINFLDNIKIINLIYFLYGCVKVPEGGTAEEKLNKIFSAIEDNQSILFFPEGKLNMQPKISEIKDGISILRSKYPEKIFFFAGINYIRDEKGKTKAKVIFGKSEKYHPSSEVVYKDNVKSQLSFLFNKII